MRGRHKHVLHSFSLNQGFIQLGFPDKVFNETILSHKRMLYTFSFIGIFPIQFFSIKVLMRHILDGHLRWSVINIISGCRYSNWLLGHTIRLLGHIVLSPQIISACSSCH